MAVTREEISALRQQYWGMQESQRQSHIVTKLAYDMNAVYQSSCIEFRYYINGKKVCGPFFQEAYPLSKQMFADARRRVRSRQLTVDEKRNDNIIPKKALSVSEFLKGYLDEHGQAIPNKQEIHLPAGVSRALVYVKYMATFTEEQIAQKEHAQESTFYQVLREDYPHVKFPRTCAFSQCNVCSQIKSAIEKAQGTYQKAILQQQRQHHLEQAASERRKFRKHWDKAKSLNRDKYMCLIIDGMTQNTTTLPHYRRKAKWIAQHKYDCHVQGIMVAGRNATMEFAYKNVSGNANMNITTLHNAILQEQNLRSEEGRPMPEVLYVQMDNVSSNKGYVLFSYLALLLEKQVFRKVKVNFLIVGHTHENIDQMFSRFSIALRTVDCLTLEELMHCARTSMKLQPNVVEVKSTIDWKAWLEPVSNNWSDVFFNHAFRLVMNEAGKAVIHSRQYAENADKSWESEPIVILREVPEGAPGTEAPLALSDDQMASLKFLQSNMPRTDRSEARDQYWNSQVEFQEKVRQGEVDGSAVQVPFAMPIGYTYHHPAPITRQQALNVAHPEIIAQIAPAARPIYAGARQADRREVRHLAEDDIFAIESIQHFDIEQCSRQVAVAWGPELGDGYSFKVNYGTSAAPLYSDPLHLLVVKKVEAESNEITWQWLAPKKFTNIEHRHVGDRLARGVGTWYGPAESTKALPFNKDEILIAWETPNGEKLWQIPAPQYKKLTLWLKARAVRLEEESREQILALEYNVE